MIYITEIRIDYLDVTTAHSPYKQYAEHTTTIAFRCNNPHGEMYGTLTTGIINPLDFVTAEKTVSNYLKSLCE